MVYGSGEGEPGQPGGPCWGKINRVSDRQQKELDYICQVLRRWDPIGVAGEDSGHGTDDEYDSYAPEILELLQSGCSPETLTRHLLHIRLNEMGGAYANFTADAEVADELVGWYGTHEIKTH